MLQFLFDLTEPEMIMEIMNGAPRYWSLYIDTAGFTTVTELQGQIKYHEEQLYKDPQQDQRDLIRCITALENHRFS